MTTPTNPIQPFTPFLPSNYYVPEEEDRIKDFLEDTFASVSDVVNDKKIGVYLQQAETLNGNKFFYDLTTVTRNGYQYLARIVSYPSTGIVVIPSPPDINPQFVVSNVWGSASKPPSAVGAGDGDFFSYYSQGNAKITFTMTDLLITVTTAALGTGYTGFVIVEYIRAGI